MSGLPAPIFLDTNVYIVGAAIDESPEAKILNWVGFGADPTDIERRVEVILSDALIEQITRVARRIRGKDWSGEILAEIWQGMNVRFVVLDLEEVGQLESQGVIPREDVTVYLSAKVGRAAVFVSANHKLVRILAERLGDFLCCTPSEFVEQFLA